MKSKQEKEKGLRRPNLSFLSEKINKRLFYLTAGLAAYLFITYFHFRCEQFLWSDKSRHPILG